MADRATGEHTVWAYDRAHVEVLRDYVAATHRQRSGAPSMSMVERLPTWFKARTAECVARGFDELPITFDHAEAVGRLPPHHHDPFDRILLGQATIEDYRLVTADRAFSPYGVELVDPST